MVERLQNEPMDVPELATTFEIRASEVVNHVEHISKSLSNTDQQLLVAPPTCQDCGFDDFDDLINRPGRCPRCKSEAVSDPTFAIE
jgi:predicted Zn-ribbon and HTH transcriptional regulator